MEQKQKQKHNQFDYADSVYNNNVSVDITTKNSKSALKRLPSRGSAPANTTFDLNDFH